MVEIQGKEKKNNKKHVQAATRNQQKELSHEIPW